MTLGKGLDALIPPQEGEGAGLVQKRSEVSLSGAAPSPSGHGAPPEGGASEGGIASLPAGRQARILAGDSSGSQREKPRGAHEAIFHIEVDKITPNPEQPRRSFDEGGIKELAASIREFGLLQPIVVTKVEKEVPTGTEVEYQLISGERRLMAAKLLGLERIPAIVRHVNAERERLELALIENIQREDLNPIELARAYSRLQDEFRMTQREIAARIGKSREAVANTLRLLDLPNAIQEAVRDGRISESHGRLLLAVAEPGAQEKLFRDLVDRHLTTRELKGQVAVVAPVPARGSALPPDLKTFEERLSSDLGTPVRIRQHGESGRITIHFYSREELEHLLGRLAGKEEAP